MLRKSLLALGCTMIPMAASAFFALNRTEVIQLSPDVFEVVGVVGSGAQDYWCGAGDYAISVLRTKATQRVYMWSEIGPSQARPGARAIQFSLKVPPSGPAPQSYSLSMKRIGDNMTASMAQGYCRAAIIPDF
jgi:hypothetical protein